MPAPDRDQPLSFGVFQVNFKAQELRKHGVRIKLGPQPFRILAMLLEKPGEIVTREELQARIWPADTFVDFEQGLNGAVKKLRTALGDSPENPRYIETLPRIGYRFVAPVRTLEERPGAKDTESIGAAKQIPPQKAPEAISSAEANRRGRSIALFGAIAAIVAVVALIVAVTVVLSLRKPKIRLTTADTMIVAPFENTTGEAVFDDALHQGLLVGLEQSPYFQIYPERKAATILKQMGRSSEERLQTAAVVELCQRAGGKVAVQGAISNLGSAYLIGLTAYRCDNGEAIAHDQAQAGKKEEVLDALQQATTRMRPRLGESLPSIQKYNAPLEQATTSSLEALKVYGKGLLTSYTQGDRQAIPYFQRAIELDPNFAMAYGRLASIYDNAGETQMAKEAVENAFAHREHCTESERLWIEAWYNLYATGDLEKAASILEAWLQSYPPSANVTNDLAAIYGNLGRYEKAVDLLKRSIELDPTDGAAYSNLAVSLMALNRLDEARAAIDEADRHTRRVEYLLEARYWGAFLRNDPEEMERTVSAAAEDPESRAVLARDQSNTETYFGRFAKARELSETAAEIFEKQGDREAAAICLAEAAVREAEAGGANGTRDLMERALKLSRNQDVVVLSSLVAAQGGEPSKAEAIMDMLSKEHPASTLIQKYWAPVIRARVELRTGRARKALATLEPTLPYDFAEAPAFAISVMYPCYVRGEAALALGDFPAAQAEFQKIVDHPGMGLNFPLQSLAFLQLGRAQAGGGDKEKARESYGKFLQRWKAAEGSLALKERARAEYQALLKNSD